ncbi:type II toxin-antitoxin system PemK/MazF family toxin [Lacimonas salitolerans]|uniref:Type II toxin-antitoxin system PemK/MazF family toxin n=1 Tax=Lacimonas salitolerans TaxID=1323750 RepID=A0ABW4EHS2_9RHOB
MDGGQPQRRIKGILSVGAPPPERGHVAETVPPRVLPELRRAPRIGELYWCRLPKDAELPEMWKTRPVVIISPANTLSGSATLIPTSTVDQGNNKWAELLETSIDGETSYAICDQLLTLAVSRLKAPELLTPRLGPEEINRIVTKIHLRLPQPR